MCNKSLKYAVALLVIDTCNIFPGQGRGARVAASAQQTGHEPLKWNDQHQRGRGQKCQRQGAPLEEVKQVLQFLQRSKILSPQAVPNITFWSENLTVGLSKNAKNWHTRCARWWNDINIEHTLNTLWTHTECTLNTLWTHSEHTLNTLWTHSEHAVNTLWTHSEHTLNTPWKHSEHTQNTPWTHSEHTLYALWTHSEHTLKTHTGCTLNTL